MNGLYCCESGRTGCFRCESLRTTLLKVGVAEPFRAMEIWSPMATSLLCRLFRLPRETLVMACPLISTGSNITTGVIVPVLPTLNSMFRTVVTATSGGNFHASAQFGMKLDEPHCQLLGCAVGFQHHAIQKKGVNDPPAFAAGRVFFMASSRLFTGSVNCVGR